MFWSSSKNIDHFRRRGYPFLVWLTIGVMLVSPLSDAHPRAGAILAVINLLSILLGAGFAGNRKIVRYAAIPLSFLWMAARLLEEFGNGLFLYHHSAHFIGLALTCTILWAILGHMADVSQVTSSVIAEAAIGYLVVAITFAQLYWILNELVADAFTRQVRPSESAIFLYLSMTSLTGLGNGAILPVNPFVRVLVAFESMTGIFFVAVVVARLVSSYRARPRGENPGETP
jgi:hypothetical protein